MSSIILLLHETTAISIFLEETTVNRMLVTADSLLLLAEVIAVNFSV
jgi:hypothetical protein